MKAKMQSAGPGETVAKRPGYRFEGGTHATSVVAFVLATYLRDDFVNGGAGIARVVRCQFARGRAP